MKANRKFIKEDKHAVSAVIGVILMVAITVAIAATVYVYVTGMIQTGSTETENAGVVANQLAAGDDRLKVTLSKGGQRYGDGYEATDYSVFVSGVVVDVSAAGTWIVGEGLVLSRATTTAPWLYDDGAGAQGAIAGTYAVTVTIMDNVVFDSDVRIV